MNRGSWVYKNTIATVMMSSKLLSEHLDASSNREIGSSFLCFGKASKHKLLEEISNFFYFLGIFKMKHIVGHKPKH